MKIKSDQSLFVCAFMFQYLPTEDIFVVNYVTLAHEHIKKPGMELIYLDATPNVSGVN